MMKTLVQKWMNSAAYSPDEGGAPAPAAPAPSPTPAADSTPADTSSSSDDFSGFAADDFESVEIPEGQASEPGPAPAGGDKVVPAASVVDPAAPVAPPAPAAPAPAPAAPPAPEPQKGVPSPSDVKSIIDGISANAEALVDHFASNVYKLTPQQAEAFETNAVEEVPKLMARVHLEATKNTLSLIQQLVPKLIEQGVERLTGTKERAKEAITEFYAANTHLNAKDHGAAVTKWANAFRAANPKASRKDAIEYVGRAVAHEFGIVPGAPQTKKAVPFAPARQGARQPIQTQEPENPFAGIGMDLED